MVGGEDLDIGRVDAGEGVFASVEIVRCLLFVGLKGDAFRLPSSLADGDDAVVVGLEEFGHAQAHISDRDDPHGCGTHDCRCLG